MTETHRRRTILSATGLMAGVFLAGCAAAPPDDPRDPLEPVNRAIFAFNDTADHYVLRPVAKGYVAVTPAIIRTGIANFFDNLGYPTTIVNDLLQLKLKQTASDTGRLVVNSVAGVGGFVDVGSHIGLSRHDEDFGQTLGYWGVGEGWYLMLPLLGPSDNRDLIGLIGDMPTKPSFWLDGDHDWLKYATQGVQAVSDRAALLDVDAVLAQQLDKYLFIRGAYLQRRQSLVYDGHPPAPRYDVDDDKAPDPASPRPTTLPADRK